jgi:AraC-like DNA-binding protein/quercetin dioxygenase-like cupin family protein
MSVSSSRRAAIPVDQTARLDWLERLAAPVVAMATDFAEGYKVEPHSHRRAQLLHALSGVVMVSTPGGRWLVPPEHAMWLPAGTVHSVEMLGEVRMRSLYVEAGTVAGLPGRVRVVAIKPLVRSLLIEAVEIDDPVAPSPRDALVLDLLLHEIPALEERPLGLPLPTHPGLSALCRRFLQHPTPHETIDDWAGRVGMSRRTFTRTFLRETGISHANWRRQACLFAALPRLAEGEPVTSVALDLGYDSVPAFTTMFRRTLGTSPRAYLNGPRANA